MLKNPDWTRSEDDALSNGRATAPFVAAERGFIGEVIESAQTRPNQTDPRARAVREQVRQEPTKEAWEHSVVSKGCSRASPREAGSRRRSRTHDSTKFAVYW